MPLFYSELQQASLENLSADPTPGVAGRVVRNTTEARAKLDDGSNYRAFLVNDQRCVIGNNGTANNNIRLHRGADSVLQLVQGGDSTAEGSLSTALAQLSARAENYLDASKPANGNAGRVIYVSDIQSLQVDNGTSWVPIGSGGGGGASLVWEQSVSGHVAPTRTVLGLVPVFQYEAALTQSLFAIINIPNGFLAGRQANLRLKVISEDTSGNVLLRAQSTLIRTNVDAYDSTTNQRTTTNTAITMSGANTKEPQQVVLDLTSSTGQVNSVSISGGDILIVRLYRDTDTATGPLYFVVGSEELTFS